MFVKLCTGERFGKMVGGHLVRRTVGEFDRVCFNMLPDKVKLNVNMLCPSMILRIIS